MKDMKYATYKEGYVIYNDHSGRPLDYVIKDDLQKENLEREIGSLDDEIIEKFLENAAIPKLFEIAVAAQATPAYYEDRSKEGGEPDENIIFAAYPRGIVEASAHEFAQRANASELKVLIEEEKSKPHGSFDSPGFRNFRHYDVLENIVLEKKDALLSETLETLKKTRPQDSLS